MGKFLVFLFLLNAAFLQAQIDSLQAEQWVSKAKNALLAEKWDSVNLYLQGARAYFSTHDQLAPWLKTYSAVAYALGGNFKQPALAVQWIEAGFREKWREPANAREWEQYTMNHLAAGHVLRVNAGDYIGAKKYYEKALELFTTRLGEHSDRVARYLYHHLANIYTRLGDYERAINLFHRSLEYNRRYPDAKVVDHGDLAIALNEIDRHEEALQVVRQGLSYQDLGSDLKISLYQNEADALFKLGKAEEAIASIDKIPDLIRQMVEEEGDEDEQNYRSQYHASKAEILIALKQFSAAEKHCKEAIICAKKHWGTEHRREIGKIYDLLGNIKLEQKQPRAALECYHRALRCVLPALPEDIGSLPASTLFYSENTILEALYGKARAFQALGKAEMALECHELIPVVEAKLRATHSYESSSLLALKESRMRFQEAIDIAWQLYENSGGKPEYIDRAFRLTELSRGMLLLQSLTQSRQFLPDSIRNREYELREQMAQLEHEIAGREENAVSGTSDLEARLFSLKQERQNLLAAFPSYNNPDALILQVFSAKEAPSFLRPDQALVDYFFTEKAAYIFSIDHQGMQWRKRELPANFRENIRSIASYLWKGEESGAADFLQKAWMVDSLMLMPEQRRWKGARNSLVVVPDDVLMLLPFEALPTGRPSGVIWRDQPWLLKDFNLSYAFSATLLGQQIAISEEHARISPTPANFAGFAPEYSATGVYALRNTRPMVENVCGMLGGEAWLGAKSSEERFKKSASGYRTLLLAMHGISDAEHPELSRLLFGDPGPDSLVNNNVLYAPELQIMQLQADLVVLSACHSGAGKMETGEGIYSIARAFAAARVPSTVMSLWLLHEETAPAMIESFFRYLQAGKSKDEALRLAKLDFLQDDRNYETTHPFYWAGLVASGDMRSLQLTPVRPSWQRWAWIGLIPIVLIFFLGWKYRNRISSWFR